MPKLDTNKGNPRDSNPAVWGVGDVEDASQMRRFHGYTESIDGPVGPDQSLIPPPPAAASTTTTTTIPFAPQIRPLSSITVCVVNVVIE